MKVCVAENLEGKEQGGATDVHPHPEAGRTIVPQARKASLRCPRPRKSCAGSEGQVHAAGR